MKYVYLHDSVYSVKGLNFAEKSQFIWLISKAIKYEYEDLTRGQFRFTERQLAKVWEISRANVNRFLKKLVKLDLIRVIRQGTLKSVSVYEIVDFDKHQTKGEPIESPSGQGKSAYPEPTNKKSEPMSEPIREPAENQSYQGLAPNPDSVGEPMSEPHTNRVLSNKVISNSQTEQKGIGYTKEADSDFLKFLYTESDKLTESQFLNYSEKYDNCQLALFYLQYIEFDERKGVNSPGGYLQWLLKNSKIPDEIFDEFFDCLEHTDDKDLYRLWRIASNEPETEVKNDEPLKVNQIVCNRLFGENGAVENIFKKAVIQKMDPKELSRLWLAATVRGIPKAERFDFLENYKKTDLEFTGEETAKLSEWYENFKTSPDQSYSIIYETAFNEGQNMSGDTLERIEEEKQERAEPFRSDVPKPDRLKSYKGDRLCKLCQKPSLDGYSYCAKCK